MIMMNFRGERASKEIIEKTGEKKEVQNYFSNPQLTLAFVKQSTFFCF